NRCTCPGTAAISVLLSLFLDINATVRLDKKANHRRQRYYRRYRHELATRVSPLDLGRKAFLAPLPTDAAGAPAESAILRQHRQHRLRNKSACPSPAEEWFTPAPSPLSLTRLTVLTVSCN